MTKSGIQILAEGFAYGTVATLLSLAAFAAVVMWALTRSRSEIQHQANLPMHDGQRRKDEG